MDLRLNQLRYSPVNGMIVGWGINGKTFNDCGLPRLVKRCEAEGGTPIDCCEVAPMAELVDTAGWARWLPEVIVGIKEPSEEIAANYVREAAIDFAKESKTLQRRMFIKLQDHERVYPLEAFAEERIIGVLAIIDPRRELCIFRQHTGVTANYRFSFNASRSELYVESPKRCGILEIIVWAAPSEDACLHDVYLYEEHRSKIAREARSRYVAAYHFRDRELLSVQQPRAIFEKDMEVARLRSTKWLTPRPLRPGRAFG